MSFSSVSAADFNAAESINALGLDLYRQLSAIKKSGNLVISPYSIQSALALVYAGAEGETRREMAKALRLPSENDSLAAGLARIRESLTEAVAKSEAEATRIKHYEGDASPIAFDIANRLYAQSGAPFRDTYTTFARDRLLAPLESVDFGIPEIVRTQINRWVAANTRERIKDLIAPGALSRDNKLVLVNALYLKAAWSTPFYERATKPLPFHLANNSTRDVPMMVRTGRLGYNRSNGITAVSLDYIGSALQLVVILPDATTNLEQATANLDAAHFPGWAKLPEERVALELPKFREESAAVSLQDALAALGISRAFDRPAGSADFSRIAPRKPDDYLFISDVVHKTFIAVDEQGTEAAAATAVLMVAGSAAISQPPVRVRFDRPFLFAIQDKESGVCLFLGRIDDPR